MEIGNGKNYVDSVREALSQKIPDANGELLDLYTLLAFVRGSAVTLEDVHDAWSVWRSRTNPHHKSLIPFGGLAPEVQQLDQKYADAITEVAHAVQGAMPPGEASCAR
ncbi:hypothetical protein [Streptomyces sp. 5-10]|uniref:DUF7701 domain-containing protein n=1 Tax=Streptomyces sp. 5-10 TaxID=878925 RepID=UPI00168BF18A|nr:hypothetical protein [Streptomyces sp. 5-10]MBD3004802.1 hypothetical protein [Streptomyces sp. 5-10]